MIDAYGADDGRAGIDSEVAVRLMLAGFMLGIVHDRRPRRDAQVNLAIRWVAGQGLHAVLPDHASLTRLRQRPPRPARRGLPDLATFGDG